MTVKCNCNHCSAHLEFDSASAGSVIPCPTCGMDTTLYVPGQKPFAPITNRPAIPSSSAESLKQIRQQSCYGTLRGLIDLIQYIIFAGAALLAVGSVAGFFIGIFQGSAGAASGTVGIILGWVLACVIVVLAIAMKQAALLLVDIADCQIQLVAHNPAQKP
jgi:hypothetical protein